MKTTNVAQLELGGMANEVGAGVDVGPVDSGTMSQAQAREATMAERIQSTAQIRGDTKHRRKSEGSTITIESLLTFAEAARVLGISLRQFRRLVDGGKVAFVKVSERSPRVRPSELQRFFAASAVKYSEVQS